MTDKSNCLKLFSEVLKVLISLCFIGMNDALTDPGIFLSFSPPSSTLMDFTEVTNAHGPSPYLTVCRSPTCSLTTATGSNQAIARFKPTGLTKD